MLKKPFRLTTGFAWIQILFLITSCLTTSATGQVNTTKPATTIARSAKASQVESSQLVRNIPAFPTTTTGDSPETDTGSEATTGATPAETESDSTVVPFALSNGLDATTTTQAEDLDSAVRVTTPAVATANSIPKGWPVKGTVTSVFGYRASIAQEILESKNEAGISDTVSVQLMGKGGSQPVTVTAATTASSTKATGVTTTGIVSPEATTAVPVTTTNADETQTVETTTSGTTQPVTSAIPTIDLTPTPDTTGTTATTSETSQTSSGTPDPTLNSATPSPAHEGTEFHPGIDIAVPIGTEVRATADGVVQKSGNEGNYGLAVFIDHLNGYVTIYGHNSRLLVEPGQYVHRGDVIALSGNTGYSTGPHVHYEIRINNQATDPAPFMVEE